MAEKEQFSGSQEKIFTVFEFVDSINRILIAQKAIIQGEIGEKISCYPKFSIFYLLDKNKEAMLKCFIWKNQLDTLGIELKPGLEVKVGGSPEVVKKRGDFTFQVEKIGLVGEGTLKQAFEALKRKLDQAGFFDIARKRPLPRFCQKIGLITSQYGKGALPDFKKHLGEYGFQVYVYDARVEGFSAIDDIVGAIRWFNENMPDIDVLVLTRGGGNWESLQAFNSEILAKAIYSSKTPIICGVGHETDKTIADYVADIRASTPTDAARILSDSWRLATIQIIELEKYFISSINKLFKHVRERIEFFGKNLIYKIKFSINKESTKIDKLFQDLTKNKDYWKEQIRKILKQEEEKLVLSSPVLKLKQGYTMTIDEFGQIIKDPAKLKISQTIKTKFYKGQIYSEIKKI